MKKIFSFLFVFLLLLFTSSFFSQKSLAGECGVNNAGTCMPGANNCIYGIDDSGKNSCIDTYNYDGEACCKAATVSPSDPTNLNVTNIGCPSGTSQADIGWTVPSNNGGSPIATYYYYFTGSGTQHVSNNRTMTVSTRSIRINIPKSQEGTPITWGIQAQNDAGLLSKTVAAPKAFTAATCPASSGTTSSAPICTDTRDTSAGGATGDYCGGDFVDNANPNTLYKCFTYGKPPIFSYPCKNGCHPNVFDSASGVEADYCNNQVLCENYAITTVMTLCGKWNGFTQNVDENTLYTCPGGTIGYSAPTAIHNCGSAGCDAKSTNDTCNTTTGSSNSNGSSNGGGTSSPTSGNPAKLTIHVSGNVTNATFHSVNHNIGNCNDIFHGSPNFTTTNKSITCTGTPIGDSGNTTKIVSNTAGLTGWTINSGTTYAKPNSDNSLTVNIPAGNTADVTANYGNTGTPISLVVGLDGVGATGTHKNPVIPAAKISQPVNKSFPVKIELFSGTTLKYQGSGTIDYQTNGTSLGKFKTTTAMNSTVTAGSYTVKISVPGYKSETPLPNAETFIANETTHTITQSINLLTGDVNNDGEFGVDDYVALVACDGKKTTDQNCKYADLDDNGIVDVTKTGFDYNLFLSEYPTTQITQSTNNTVSAPAQPTALDANMKIAFNFYSKDLAALRDPNLWRNELNSAYNAYKDLTGITPYGGNIITYKEVPDSQLDGAACRSGNPITCSDSGLPAIIKSVNDYHNVGFGQLHELGHNFGWNTQVYPYLDGNLDAINDENWANFKVTYVADTIYTKYPGISLSEDGKPNPLENLGKGYFVPFANQWLAGDRDWTKMKADNYTGLLYTLVEKYGWDPFKKTFHDYATFQSQNKPVPSTDLAKFQLFADTLAKNAPAGNDIKTQFKSWGIPIQ
jgi:hypothetical protein